MNNSMYNEGLDEHTINNIIHITLVFSLQLFYQLAFFSILSSINMVTRKCTMDLVFHNIVPKDVLDYRGYYSLVYIVQ